MGVASLLGILVAKFRQYGSLSWNKKDITFYALGGT